MNKYLLIIIGILSLLGSSCGSDEPEPPYTGPWQVAYYEEYSYIHNESPEFIDWFNSHLDNFVECQFYDGHNTYYYSDYVELDDYKNYHTGSILWIEIVNNATEDEIKLAVDRFQKFSIQEANDSRKFDLFDAYYQRYEDKW